MSISYVECEYIWSKPNGETNAALTDKYLTKYQHQGPIELPSISAATSKSAAAMLQERQEQLNKGIEDHNANLPAAANTPSAPQPQNK